MIRAAAFVLLLHTSLAHSQEGWIELLPGNLDAFKGGPMIGEWYTTTAVSLDPANPKKLAAKEENGPIWVNGPKGRTKDLFTKQNFGDVEVHLEFVMAKNSNSGIKFHGHYEIQITDSFGKKELTGDDCGGVYPRAELKPKYHHIDKGIAPRVNAAKAPGEWQTLDIVFKAPRFDAEGKKISNAMLVKVLLNGTLIHENQELKTPTGDRWKNPEMKEGPIMLQGDHGPVAFRNVKVRALK
jgi:hypothetical protein